MIQLDFFQVEEKNNHEILCELAYVKELAKSTHESSNKVRKSLFARHGELAKMYLDLSNRLEIIEHNICKQK